jgi:putative phage-type endonuclease
MTPEVVCEDTRLLDRSEWLKLRRDGLGSSDAAVAMDMSPWVSTYSLWSEKRGYLAEQEDRERFLWGRLIEPSILDQAELRGWVDVTARGLMLRSPERPYMLANPDGLTDSAVVEAKTADSFDEKRWDEGVPDQYAIQAHHLMYVADRKRCVFPVLFGFGSFKQFVVEWDDELAEVMLDQEERFWKRVTDDDPPDPDGSESTMLALRERYKNYTPGLTIDLGEPAREWLDNRNVSHSIVKSHQAEVDRAKAHLMALMGDAEVAFIGGQKIATWKSGKSGTRTFRFSEVR